MTEPDPLAGLRDQIRSATEAAERLVRDARAAGVGPGRPTRPRRAPDPPTPPAGWEPDGADGVPAELVALARLLGVLREILPAELQQQATDLVRQLLVLLRALIDWAVTRLEQEHRGREVEVVDIPIA
ncbi:MAG TPA: hypothetical protein VFR49_10930 [Solirubrobacteraceae bacterium]|nr:hypothetical protein [Solirubrobacteraceae bacterium]